MMLKILSDEQIKNALGGVAGDWVIADHAYRNIERATLKAVIEWGSQMCDCQVRGTRHEAVRKITPRHKCFKCWAELKKMVEE